MSRGLSDLKKLAKLKKRRQVVEKAIDALERLKEEYGGKETPLPDPISSIGLAERRKRKTDRSPLT